MDYHAPLSKDDGDRAMRGTPKQEVRTSFDAACRPALIVRMPADYVGSKTFDSDAAWRATQELSQ